MGEPLGLPCKGLEPPALLELEFEGELSAVARVPGDACAPRLWVGSRGGGGGMEAESGGPATVAKGERD